MDRSQPKYHVLIVSINSSIRPEFQSYLHKICLLYTSSSFTDWWCMELVMQTPLPKSFDSLVPSSTRIWWVR